jgi:hypothetical protein
MNQSIDRCLEELALAARQHPSKSKERQRLLGKLIATLQTSGKLYRPACPEHLKGFYQEIYETAKQNLFRYICENIELYNPERGNFLQWANFLLGKRFPDAIRELTNSNRNLSKEIRIVSLDELDSLQTRSLNDESNLSLGEQVIQIIEEDPECLFNNRTMQSNPKVTFKVVALKRAQGYEWEEIAAELGSKIQALNNFYQRSLKQFIPIIQSYLSN